MFFGYLLRACCFYRICGVDRIIAAGRRVLHDTDRGEGNYQGFYRPHKKNASGAINKDHHCIVANHNTGEIYGSVDCVHASMVP